MRCEVLLGEEYKGFSVLTLIRRFTARSLVTATAMGGPLEGHTDAPPGVDSSEKATPKTTMEEAA